MKLALLLLVAAAAVAPPKIFLDLDESAQLTKLAPGIAREHDQKLTNPNGKKVGSQQDWTQRCPAGASTKKSCPFPSARAVDHQDKNVQVHTRIFLVDADGKTQNKEVPKVDFSKRSTYLFKYDATDNAGNHAEQVVFALILDDTTAPVINMCGKSHELVQAATSWTLCGDSSATDNVDGSVNTLLYTVKSGANILTREVPLAMARTFVNSRKVGKYAVTITATDKAGIYGKGGQNNVASVTKMVVVRDTLKPIINLYGYDSPVVQCGKTYTDAGAIAKDKLDGTIAVTKAGTVNTKKVGDYTIAYTAEDAAGNRVVKKRTVLVRDTIKPTIALKGAQWIELPAGTKYTDAGVTKSDTCSSVKVSKSGKVNTSKVGTYKITYTATDGAGNTASVSRKVAIVDKKTPILKVVGAQKMTLQATRSQDWTDPGATCSDSVDGNLNNMVEVSGDTVNLRIAGEYTIKYNCMDISGNKALQLTRTVKVIDNTCPKITLLGAKQVTVEAGYKYKDAGATASDSLDGSLTSAVWSDGASVSLYKSFTSAQSCHEIKRSYPEATSGAYVISAYANKQFIQLEAWCDMHTVAAKMGKVGFTYVKAPEAIKDETVVHFTFDNTGKFAGINRHNVVAKQLYKFSHWYYWRYTVIGECKIEAYKGNMAWHVTNNAQLSGSDKCAITTKNAMKVPSDYSKCKVSLLVKDIDYVRQSKESDDKVCLDVMDAKGKFLTESTCQKNDIKRRLLSNPYGNYDLQKYLLNNKYHKESNQKLFGSESFHYFVYHSRVSEKETTLETDYIPYSKIANGINVKIQAVTDHNHEHWYADDLKIICQKDACASVGLGKALHVTPSAITKFGKKAAKSLCSPNDEQYNLAHKRVTPTFHSHPGKYLVTYHVADRDGNKECKAPKRTVTVVDTLPPVIKLRLNGDLIHTSGSLMEESQTSVNGWIIGSIASAVAGVALLGYSSRRTPTIIAV